MNNEFTYKRYSPEYKDQIIKLLNNLWNFPDKEKYEYFKWKYEDNPYSESPVGYIALDGDKVVAFRGYMIEPMRLGNSEFLNAQLADTVTHPEYRRRGLFQAITRYSLTDLEHNPDIKMSLNSSSGGPTVGGYLKLGWKPLTERGHLFRFTVKGLISKIGHNQILFNEMTKTVRDKTFICSSKLRAEDFCSLKSDQSRISHIRTPEFYKWRLKNPRNKFVYTYLYSNSELDSFFIFSDLGNGRYDIIDFNSKDKKSLKTLLSLFCKEQNPLYVSLWTVGNNNVIYNNPRDFGFTNIQKLLNHFKKFKKPPFLIRQILKIENVNMYDKKCWDLFKILADEI